MILIYTYFALNIGLSIYFYQEADEELRGKGENSIARPVAYIFLFLFGTIILLAALLTKIFFYTKEIYDKFR